MKTLLAFFLILGFLAVPVFADTLGVGGHYHIGAQLAKGDTETDNDATTGMDVDFEIYVGGHFRNIFGAKGTLIRNYDFWVYAWWKPVPFFMTRIGTVFEDTTWAGADITGKGFHGNEYYIRQTENFAGNVLQAEVGFFNHIMNAAQERRVLQLSFYPVKGLALNLGVPMAGANPNTAEDNYIYRLHAQAVYNISGVGEAAISFINAPDAVGNFQNIFAQWKMPIGNAMRFELGVNLGLNAVAFEPLKLGFGFGYGNLEKRDTFVCNFRLGASIAMEDNHATNIGIDIAPSYDFKIFRLYVPFGLGINMPASGDENIFWSFNPYIEKRLGGPFLFAGVLLYSGTWASTGRLISTDGITWSIPVGFRWDF